MKKSGYSRREEIAVEAMNREELEELRNRVDDRLAEVEKERRKEAFLAARATAEKYGYNLTELVSEFTKTRVKKVVEPKYRHPETGETWTGRGPRPKWFRAAVEGGLSPEEMTIKNG